MRFELERLGVIVIQDRKAKLLTRFYDTSSDIKETFLLGSLDVSDLLVSIQENGFQNNPIPNLQARTQYDNIPDENLNTIREWFLRAGSEFHDNARTFLSKFDRDISGADAQGQGRNRIVVGTYSRVQPEPEGEK